MACVSHQRPDPRGWSESPAAASGDTPWHRRGFRPGQACGALSTGWRQVILAMPAQASTSRSWCSLPRSLQKPPRELPRQHLLSSAAVVLGAWLSTSQARKPRVARKAGSLLERLFAPHKSQAEVIHEEIAQLRRQSAEDLEELRTQLSSQGPSEQDLRVEALRRQQEQIARLVDRKKARRRPAQVARSPARSTAARAQPAQAQPAPPAQPAQPARPPAPPAPWRCHLDMDSGCWYYHNEVTNVTAWELPTLMRDRPPAPPAPWQLVAHNSGRWYYHNTRTNATSWSRPRKLPAAKRRCRPRSRGRSQSPRQTR
ncbi:unnamed protein product [Effrenium voratum]|nr:unnamed protein product [Effrenium voratum]